MRSENKAGKKFRFGRIAVTVIVLVIFARIYLAEAINANTYQIEIAGMDPALPVADVKQPVTFQVKLSRNGNPVAGHTLYALPLDGGRLRKTRADTDENGIAEFIYVPYTETKLMPARDVRIYVIDEDNSTLIEVNAEAYLIIPLKSKN